MAVRVVNSVRKFKGDIREGFAQFALRSSQILVRKTFPDVTFKFAHTIHYAHSHQRIMKPVTTRLCRASPHNQPHSSQSLN
jgi:hypothetical protein